MAAVAGDERAEAFIERWSKASAGERSNYQLFLIELCELIGVERPGRAVADESRNAYVFERRVTRRRSDGTTSANYIDLYKRGCFVLEAKQSKKRDEQVEALRQLGFELAEQRVGSGRREGTQWDALMRNAREQAEGYAKRLPASEGWPPFLVIADIGHVIELYADFSLQGKNYVQFPDRQTYRIYLEELRQPEIRERLALVWSDPAALDPARRTAEVTREVAELLARLSRSLETRLLRQVSQRLSREAQAAENHAIAEKVALFLMRCLFTMFAEDVGLLTPDSFKGLLERYRGKADKLHIPLRRLWQDMERGDFSPDLGTDVRRFNGGLFKGADALPIDEDDLELLLLAAQRHWKNVEPAIFGTLLERALDERERGKLGAHYTPRAYVERLVVATIVDPLAAEWRDVEAAAAHLLEAGDAKGARREVRAFHERLCKVRVLDPACGTGNFLYVALELMKRLEGEILETLKDLGEDQYLLELDRHTVDPHQFLGLEINPRAVAIAELVLWIGYLQWHFRTRGKAMPAEPVLKKFDNIREQDAILAYDSWDVLRDERGRPVTRWDGVTYKLHPITGEEVPDEAARIELRTYKRPRPATWPEAEFIVGNPPFVGGNDMRQELGDGYAEACWQSRPHVPRAADFVMHFWDSAAETVRLGKARRFGLITTNSITQTFSRRVVEANLSAKKPLSLIMAIPDHPWLKSADKAAVRIAMTVGAGGVREGILRKSITEIDLDTDSPKVELSDQQGKIQSNLRIGVNLGSIKRLKANEGISTRGICLIGQGFVVQRVEAPRLGLGSIAGLERHIKPYFNGRDITHRPRNILVIDLQGLTSFEVQQKYPAVFQWILDRVKPERDQNREAYRRENWWVFGRKHTDLRASLRGLDRFIVTPMTAKHRFFLFLEGDSLPDQGLVSIGHRDGLILGTLSSRIHVVWAVAVGGRLGVGNDPRYNNTVCFDAFPFPDPPEALKARIRELGERLDAHRKSVLKKHRQLTMTGLYNVLEKVKAGVAPSDAEKDVYEAGLVGVLKQIHDGLDAAVTKAYGWPADLSDEEILERLVALNHERAAEEAAGKVRWLRPEFQAPKEAAAAKKKQLEAELIVVEGKAEKKPLPPQLSQQVAAVRAALAEAEAPLTASELCRGFTSGRKAEKKVEEVLRTLALLGQAEQVGGGYVLMR